MNVKTSEIIFLKKFFSSFAVLFALVLVFPMQPLLEAIAAAQQQILTAFGVAALAQGSLVYAGPMVFEIVNECSSLVMLALLAALLYATGAKKISNAIAVGFPLLFVFNLMRLAFTIGAGAAYGKAVLEAVHFSLWIADALVVLALWTKLSGLPFASPAINRR